MAKDCSIYEIEKDWNKRAVVEYIIDMKIIIIKGVGYFAVGKNTKVDSELLLNLATSMENRNIVL